MVWKNVPGFEARYEVSDKGVIRSKLMMVGARGGNIAFRKGRELKQAVKRNGYRQVTLTSAGGDRVSALVHCVVAEAFIGPRPTGAHVCHFDGDKTNNRLDNLRYGTPAENHSDSKRLGRVQRGENHHAAKIDEDTAASIKSADQPRKNIAAQFGVSLSLVHQIKSGRTWRHVE